MKQTQTLLRALTVGASVMLLSFAFGGAVLAEHTDGPLVAPTEEAFPGGDPICPAGTTGFRWNDPADNGATKGGVTVSWADDEVSFEASGGVLVAIAFVKGGTNQNVYDYTGQAGGGVDHDNGLIAPLTGGSQQAGVSHVDLCVFTPEATASPSPSPSPTLPPTGPTDPPTLPPTDTGSPFGSTPMSGGFAWLFGLIALSAAGLITYGLMTRAKATARRRS